MSTDLWVASCIVLVFGLIATVAGVILKSYSAAARPYEGYAEAKVVDLVHEKRDINALSEFRNRQAAVFEFYANGKLIKVTDSSDSYPCAYRRGQRVRLSYNPEDPTEYRVLGFEPRRFAAMAFSIAGIAMIIFGCVLFLLYATRFGL